jgi:hypothetical protein
MEYHEGKSGICQYRFQYHTGVSGGGLGGLNSNPMDAVIGGGKLGGASADSYR